MKNWITRTFVLFVLIYGGWQHADTLKDFLILNLAISDTDAQIISDIWCDRKGHYYYTEYELQLIKDQLKGMKQ